MTPQQRASSSVSLGALSINGLSGVVITPNQPNLNIQNKIPIVQPIKSFNTLNQSPQFLQNQHIPTATLPFPNFNTNQAHTKSNPNLTNITDTNDKISINNTPIQINQTNNV
jgi:hypothetical protein